MEPQTQPTYDAILVKDAPRFRKDRKLISADGVPEEIREKLVAELYARRALQQAAPEGTATFANAPYAQSEGGSVEQTANGTELEATETQVAEALQAMPSDFDDDPTEGLVDKQSTTQPSQYELDLISQLEDVKQQLFEYQNSKGNLSNATIFDLANELYDCFGVYTVFVNKPPQDNDVHPFSGETMTRYEVGLAYQKHTQVTVQGKLNKDFGLQYAGVLRSREAAPRHIEEMERNAQVTPRQAEQNNSFDFRTSVKGQNQTSTRTVSRTHDPISEEATAEPNLHGQTIRPDW